MNPGMSTYNYEQLLIGWNMQVIQQGTISDSLVFDAVVLKAGASSIAGSRTREDTVGIKYRLRAESARDSIITNDLWTIRDGGLTGNTAPFVSSGFPDIILREGFTRQILSTRLDTVFKDAEGDPLTFSVNSLVRSVVSSAINSNDTLLVTELTTGFDTLVVTAMDMLGGEVKDTFTVTVLPNTYFDSAFVTTWDVASAGNSISHTHG